MKNAQNALVFLLLFCVYSLLFFKVSASGLYLNQERFGVGHSSSPCSPLDNNCTKVPATFPHFAEFNFGWYHDWSRLRSEGGVVINGDQGSTKFIHQAGAYQYDYNAEVCNNFKKSFTTNSDYINNGAIYINIGNEIGWDDNKTPQQYAEHYYKWRTCVKELEDILNTRYGKNVQFKIGSGAVIDLSLSYKDPAFTCVARSSSSSMQSFFIDYTNYIKNIYGNEYLPDFFMYHPYTVCNGTTHTSSNFANVELFKKSIVDFRTLMANYGFREKELIVKEMAPLSKNSYGQGVSVEQFRQLAVTYMEQTVNYLLTAKDSNIGLPVDENRLVQRFAWYKYSPGFFETGLMDPHVALVDENKNITPLGYKYKQLILQNYEPVPSPSATPVVSPTPSKLDVNFDGKEDILDALTIVKYLFR